MRRMVSWLITGSSVLFLGSVLAWHAQGYSLQWNETPSLPKGLYHCRTVEATEPLPAAALVIFTLTPAQQAITPQAGPGPMLKQVWARAPHEVCIEGEALWIDGLKQASRPLLGRVGQGPSGCFKLGANEYLAMGWHPKSYDSRYYGPIQRSQVTATCTALATWGGWGEEGR